MAVGRYYRITPRFWQDTDVRNEWTEDMRLLAVYLMTSPHRNMVGLFYCPLVYMENDLQWQSKRLRMAFDSLSSPTVDFIRYDHKAQVAFLVNGLKHDAPGTANQVEGAVRILRNLPRTHLLKDLLDAADMECECLANAIRMQFDCNSIASRIPDTVFRTPDTVPRIPNTEERESRTASTDVDPPSPLSPSAQDIADLWNDVCGRALPRVSKLTPKRASHIKTLLKDKTRDLPWWRTYFSRILASSFCCGANDRQWKADFDFATRGEDSIVKVFEGKYDDRKPGAPGADKPIEPIVVRTKTAQEIKAELMRGDVL